MRSKCVLHTLTNILSAQRQSLLYHAVQRLPALRGHMHMRAHAAARSGRMHYQISAHPNPSIFLCHLQQCSADARLSRARHTTSCCCLAVRLQATPIFNHEVIIGSDSPGGRGCCSQRTGAGEFGTADAYAAIASAYGRSSMAVNFSYCMWLLQHAREMNDCPAAMR